MESYWKVTGKLWKVLSILGIPKNIQDTTLMIILFTLSLFFNFDTLPWWLCHSSFLAFLENGWLALVCLVVYPPCGAGVLIVGLDN